MLKRVISFLLCLAMVFSMVPVRVFAEEETAEPSESVTESTEETIVPTEVEMGLAEETTAPPEPAKIPEETTEITEPAKIPEENTEATEPAESAEPTEPEMVVMQGTVEMEYNQEAALASATVASGTCGENVTWTLSETGVLTISGEGKMDNFDSSTQPWKNYRDQITRLHVAETVTALGSYAFYKCRNLTSVSLKEGLLSIGAYAFAECYGLLDITIPDSVTTVGMKVFSQCDNMLAIYVTGREEPENCGNGWTGGRIVIKDPLSGGIAADGFTYAITGAGTAAILYYTGYAENVVIPTGIRGYSVTQISCRAFENINIKSVTIPESIQEIGFYAFYNCQYLEKIYYNAAEMTLPSEYDYNYIFYDAGKNGAGITLTIGDQVKKIPAGLFDPEHYVYGNNGEQDSDCAPKITSIIFEEGSSCEQIGSMAFAFLKELKTITFTEVAPKVGTDVFDKVSAKAYFPAAASGWTLSKRNSYGGNLRWIPVSDADLDSIAVTKAPKKQEYVQNLDTLDVTGGVITLYFSDGVEVQMNITEDMVSGFDNSIVGEQILTVTYGGLTAQYTVTVNADISWNLDDKGVLTISGTGKMGDYTSSGAPWYGQRTQVQEIIVGDGVTHIGEYAFNGFSNVKRITIGAGVASIGKYAFQDAVALEEIFYRAVSAENASTDNYIFKDAGKNSSGIAVYISAEVKRIAGFLFNPLYSNKIYRPNITKVVFAENSVCSEIGNQAFKNCTALAEINLPESLRTIGDSALNGCGFQELVIPEGVRTLESLAFSGCASLKKVTIPETVTSLDAYAFSSCVLLEEVYYNAVRVSDYGSQNNRFSLAGTSGDGITLYIGKNVAILPKNMIYLFRNPPKLTNVVFAEDSKCTEIRDYALASCKYITSITLPASLTKFGHAVFAECSALNSLHFTGDAPSFCSDTFSGITATAYYPVDNATWTESVLQNYGGTITWEPYGKKSVASGTCGENVTWKLYVDGVLTISGNGAMEDYRAVTEQPWYSYREQITEIVISDDVTKVGAYAFCDCTAAVNLTIGAGVTEIGKYAFSSCKVLTQVHYNAVSAADLPSGNWVFTNTGTAGSGITVTIGVQVQRIPAYLFNPLNYSGNSMKLVGVKFAENSICTEIGQYAFAYNKELMEFTFPESLTTIGNGVFYYCFGLKQVYFNAVNMADLNSSSALSGYAGYDNGVTVTVGAQVQRIPAYLFKASTKMISIEFAEDSVCTEIGKYAFADNDYLTEITLPEKLVTIGDYAFSDNDSLTKINLPEKLTTIGNYAFSDNESLTKIDLPDSLTAIGKYAFKNCRILTILCDGTLPESLGSGWSECAVICTSPETFGTDGNFSYWLEDESVVIAKYLGSDTSVTVPSTIEGYPVVALADRAFYDQNTLLAITLPDGLVTIGEHAFKYSDVGILQLPASVGYVGKEFQRDSQINLLQFAGDAPVFDDNAFYDETVTINYPRNNTTWTAEVMRNYGGTVTWAALDPNYVANGICGNDLTWTLDENGTLTISGTGAMTDYGQSKAPWYGLRLQITSLELSEDMTTIGDGAFNSCKNLVGKLMIPSGVTAIGDSAFAFCENLTGELVLPEKLTSIEEVAFSGCRGLTGKLVLPAGLTKIELCAFASCVGLTGELVIPKNVTSIGMMAFTGCTGLTGELVLPDSLTSIESYAFEDCRGLSSVTFGNGLNQISNYAFVRCSGLGEMTFTGATPPAYVADTFSIMLPLKTVWVPQGTLDAYTTALSGKLPDSTVISEMLSDVTSGTCGENLTWELDENGVLTISGTGDMDDFADESSMPWQGHLSSITSVVLEEGVTNIGNHVFDGCTALTNVTIPEGVSYIGSAAFKGCTNLVSITIPSSVTSIDNYAFYQCTSLTDVTVPASVTSIEKNAFDYCTELHTITFEGDAPSFGTSAFSQVMATAYYPAGNATWTEDVLQNYGGTLSWVPYGTVEKRVTLDSAELDGQTSVWMDGVEYAVQMRGDVCYVDLPDSNAKTMVSYTYHVSDTSDIHTQYPVSMKVWALSNKDGIYTATRVEELDNILQYSGMSIRITGKKGIRMITSMEKNKKTTLASDGLAGYTLKEYGTVAAWVSQMGEKPLVLGKSYAKSNYAYRKGVADPVYQYTDNLMQYTNVLVGFSLDQCRNDLAMRPYMILTDAEGNEFTLYGGIVQRSIGYIAEQNAYTFDPIAEASAYNYIWDIIHHVYGEDYVPEVA